MSKEFRVGDRVVAEQGYYEDKFIGKTGTVIWCAATPGDFSVIVEFDEKIGYGIVGRNHGGRPGCCAYGNPEHLCLIPSAPSIKFSFEDIFEAF